MAHPNETLFQQLFDAFGRGDREGAAAFFAEDAVFRYPGPGGLHGEYRGRDGIQRFWAEQDRLSGGRFRPELLDLVAGDDRVFILVRLGSDGSEAWQRVVTYDIAGGLITAARVFEDDPAAAEAFFAREGSG